VNVDGMTTRQYDVMRIYDVIYSILLASNKKAYIAAELSQSQHVYTDSQFNLLQPSMASATKLQI